LISAPNQLTQVTAAVIARYGTAVRVIARLIEEIGPKSGVFSRNAGWVVPETAVSAIIFREERRVPA
jgi:hypothetical protein